MLLCMVVRGIDPSAARRRGPAAGAALRSCGTLLITLGALILSGCGSSSSSGSGSSSSVRKVAAKGTVSSSEAAGSTTPTAAGTCRQVPAPPSRAGERAPAPTHQLDPGRTYGVTLDTNCGSIEIALNVKRAPKTAASFASLVHRGFYNDLTFHRIVRGFIIQGGDPNGNGTGGPGYHVVEAPPHDLQYTRGIVAMAKTGGEPSGLREASSSSSPHPTPGCPPNTRSSAGWWAGRKPWKRSRRSTAKDRTPKTARHAYPW